MPVTVIPPPAGVSPVQSFLDAFLRARAAKRVEQQQQLENERSGAEFITNLFTADPDKTSALLGNTAARAQISRAYPALNLDRDFPVTVGADNIPRASIRPRTEAENLSLAGARAGVEQAQQATRESQVRTEGIEWTNTFNLAKTVRDFTTDADARPLYNGKPMRPFEISNYLRALKNTDDPNEAMRRAGFDPEKITFSNKLENSMMDLYDAYLKTGYDPVEANERVKQFYLEDPAAMSRLDVEGKTLLNDLYRAQAENLRRLQEKSSGNQLTPEQTLAWQRFTEEMRKEEETALSDVYGGLGRIVKLDGYKTDKNGNITTNAPGWSINLGFMKIGGGEGKPERATGVKEASEGGQSWFTLNEIAALAQPYSPAGQKWYAEHKLPLPTDPKDPTNLRATLRAIEGDHGVSINTITVPLNKFDTKGNPETLTFNDRESFLNWITPFRVRLSQRAFAVANAKSLGEGGITVPDQRSLMRTDDQGNLLLDELGNPSYDPSKLAPSSPTDLGPLAPSPATTPGQRTPAQNAASTTPAHVPGLTPDQQRMIDSMRTLKESLDANSAATRKQMDDLLRRSKKPEATPPPTP